jgi:MoxR-like ATPase
MEKSDFSDLFRQMGTVLRGKDEALRQAVGCLLAGGHLLIEDIPGVGKTTLAYALARSINGVFHRIQFTSDMLPSDVLGVSVYEERTGSFVFHPGPVFANVVLADEINRSPPRTQSSLLECMERGVVSLEGQSRHLPRPFMVVATQNPLDFEGTYPLPENQLDRFMMRIRLGYPDRATELEILEKAHLHYDDISLEPIMEPVSLQTIQAQVREVFLESTVADYLLRLVEATRSHPALKAGVSPRGGIALKRASQAMAFLAGRSFVIPGDIQQCFHAVCGHRVLMREQRDSESAMRGSRMEELLNGILADVKQP